MLDQPFTKRWKLNHNRKKVRAAYEQVYEILLKYSLDKTKWKQSSSRTSRTDYLLTSFISICHGDGDSCGKTVQRNNDGEWNDGIHIDWVGKNFSEWVLLVVKFQWLYNLISLSRFFSCSVCMCVSHSLWYSRRCVLPFFFPPFLFTMCVYLTLINWFI